MADDEHREGEDVVDSTESEMWRLAKPPNNNEDADGQPKPGPGAYIGKLVKYLNDIEDPEEFETKLQDRDATGQSLLMWATLTNRFVLVEWLIKRAKRNAFAFKASTKELVIFDKWVEIRKELAEKEREKLEAPPEEEAEDDGEEKPPEPTADQLVAEALSDLQEEFGARFQCIVKTIGELGVYQGARDASHTKSGLGQSLFPNGDCYVGQYKDNQRNGMGTYWSAGDGIIYHGQWKNNLRHGLGRLVLPDGGRYFGNFVNNKRNGEGRYTYPDGTSYSGAWVDDVKHGIGSYTFNDGSQYHGTWVNNKFTSGEWRLAGGTRYYGAFANDRPVGRGAFVFKYGREGSYRQEGEYVDGRWTPSGIVPIEAQPKVDIKVQGRTLQLELSSDAAGFTLQQLIQIANFTPFLDWVNAFNSPKGYILDGIRVVSANYAAGGKLESVRLSPRVVDATTGSRVAADVDTITLSPASTKILVILSHGDKSFAVLQSSPNPSQCSASFLSLGTAELGVDGSFRGPFVDALANQFGITLNTQNTIPVPCGNSKRVHTNIYNSSSQCEIAVLLQNVHADTMAMIEQVNTTPALNPFVGLSVAKLSDIASRTTDAVTLLAALTVQRLRANNLLPAQTTEPQRPPTPRAPEREPRPDIEPLLAAERMREAQKTGEADE